MQGLYLHITMGLLHRKTQTNTHASSGIVTHDPSVREAKNHVLLVDSATIVIGVKLMIYLYNR